jgi:hypothetical protein
MQISRYLIVVAILFVSELLLGIGLIGVIGGLVGAIAAIVSAQSFYKRIRIATLFLGVALATFGWLILNTRIAKQHAVPVIAACKRFRSDNNRYPSDLKELTPTLLSSLPKARYTLAGRHFAYDSSRPELCFAAMFHGVFCYDFQTDRWTTNE